MPVEIILCLKMDGEGRFSKGWSEKHVYLGDPEDLQELDKMMKRLGTLRLGCCAENVWLSEIRASRPGVFRDSYRVWSKQGGDANSTLDGQGAITNMTADPSNSCLNVNLRANDQQRRTLYFAGIPDPLIRTAPVGPDGAAVPAFAKAFKQWKAYLLNSQWGFKSRVIYGPLLASRVFDYLVQPEAPYELVAVINSVDDFGEPGDEVQIRGVTSQYYTARLPNGRWYIRSKATVGTAVQMTLRNATGFDPTMFDKTGSIEPVKYEYPAYTGIGIVGQATRKRGVGPVRARGRSSRRRK